MIRVLRERRMADGRRLPPKEAQGKVVWEGKWFGLHVEDQGKGEVMGFMEGITRVSSPGP